MTNALLSAPDDAIVALRSEGMQHRWQRRFVPSGKNLAMRRSSAFKTLVDDEGRKWKDQVLALAAERFDRRLGEEIGALRLDMTKEFAAMRVEVAKEFAAVRGEMAATRFSMVKWAFLFWVGQLAAMTGIMALLLRTIVPR